MKTAYYHTASWCAPCSAIKPQVKKLCEETGVRFVEVDIDNEMPMTQLMSVPTVVLQGDGIQEVLTASSLANKQALRALFKGEL